MSTEHPDFDALSAHLDGEAPEWDAHVAACAACRTTLGRLRTTSALVAAPVPIPSPSVREQALARALDAFESSENIWDITESIEDDRHPAAMAPAAPAAGWVPDRGSRVVPGPVPAPATPITSARRRRRVGSGMWVGVGSAAAVLVAFVVGASLLAGGSGGGGGDATIAAGAPPTQERTATGLAGAPGPVTGAGADAGESTGGVDGGDLGEMADASTLAARTRTALVGLETQPLLGGIGQTGQATTATADLAPKIVGTRPCEMEVRTARPDLGTVVYYAVGRVQGTPVVVLGFSPGPATAPVTLLALAQQEGCRVVLEAAGP